MPRPAGQVTAARLGQLLAGLVVMGVGVAAMFRAQLGLSPWEVLHHGLSRLTGIQVGTVGLLVGIPILIAWWPLRQWPGVGTVLNVVVIAVTIDAVLDLTDPVHAVAPRVGLMLGGLLLVAVGSGLYLAVDLGPGPRDGLMTGIHDRFGWSIRLTRTVLEVGALVAGVALGGNAGVGTVLFAFGIGPMLQVLLGWFGFTPARIEALGSQPADAMGISGE